MSARLCQGKDILAAPHEHDRDLIYFHPGRRVLWKVVQRYNRRIFLRELARSGSVVNS
jgi:hypothetical protein